MVTTGANEDVLRNLKKRSLIAGYKIRNGVFLIKKDPNAEFMEVSHKSDFEKLGLDIL